MSDISKYTKFKMKLSCSLIINQNERNQLIQFDRHLERVIDSLILNEEG